jgi:hypothetical protein
MRGGTWGAAGGADAGGDGRTGAVGAGETDEGDALWVAAGLTAPAGGGTTDAVRGGGTGCLGGRGGGTPKLGRGTVLGETNLGAGGTGGREAAGALGGKAGGTRTAAGATDLASPEGGTGGRGAKGGGAAGCCLLTIAFRTSPGFEIFDRSILVLISSGSTRLGRACLFASCASPAPWKCARTLSASKSSIELE